MTYKIYTATTQFIEINVVPRYENDQSNPSIGKFIFSYAVQIINHGPVPVRLLWRHWYIYDTLTDMREVAGEGVIGRQPIIDSGDSFEYTSWCPINSAIGKMRGTYTMERMTDRATFEVEIPEFLLHSDYVMN
jgi:ApaG protein